MPIFMEQVPISGRLTVQGTLSFSNNNNMPTYIYLYDIWTDIAWWNLLNGSIIKSHKLIIMNLLL